MIRRARWLRRWFGALRHRPERSDAEIASSAVQDITDAIHKESRSYRGEATDDNRRNRKIAIVGVVGAYLYASLTFLQWCTTIEANKLTAHNIEMSNRAWLVVRLNDAGLVDPVSGHKLSNIESDKPFRVTLRIENTGRSPAVNVISLDGNVVVPRSNAFPIRLTENRDAPSRVVLGNGHSHDLPPLKDGLISGADMTKIRSGDFIWVAYGRIRYDDALGEGRYTDWCLYLGAEVPATPFTLSLCPTNNSIH
jgi:hypothetical protein